MSRLADAARSYIGVKFCHQGRNRAGIDCAGLVWAAYRDCGLELEDFRKYRRSPHRDGLTERVAERLGEAVFTGPVPLALLRDGDVIVIRYEIEPHHMGILGSANYGGQNCLTLIHASGNDKRVLEHRLIPQFAQQITHVYRRQV